MLVKKLIEIHDYVYILHLNENFCANLSICITLKLAVVDTVTDRYPWWCQWLPMIQDLKIKETSLG